MDDGYGVMIARSIDNLAAQVSALNDTLQRIEKNTNNDRVLCCIADSLETIARNTED